MNEQNITINMPLYEYNNLKRKMNEYILTCCEWGALFQIIKNCKVFTKEDFKIDIKTNTYYFHNQIVEKERFYLLRKELL